MKTSKGKNEPPIVKIISNDDKVLRKIGQILSSEKSRKIYSTLIDCELNAKEVAKLIDHDENPRLPNIIFHLEKMVEAGMLSVQTKQQRKNGHYLKYYKAVCTVLVVPPQYLEKAKNSKTLTKLFDQIFKLSTVALGLSILASECGFFFDIKEKISYCIKFIRINPIRTLG